jgi:casein kinase II subunit alpha
MLTYDHAQRIIPREAMNHPYFKPVKEYHAKAAAQGQQEKTM